MSIRMHILPGGFMPERQTAGAIGYDVRIRAIVSDHEMDPKNPNLRQTIFDFENLPENLIVAGQVLELPYRKNERELVYRMRPNESVLVGIGFITQMASPLFYWVAPRSGLSS